MKSIRFALPGFVIPSRAVCSGHHEAGNPGQRNQASTRE
jgi:hypothetical protein